jgi:hypothetical protein
MCRGRHEVEASGRQERSRPAAEIKKHKATIGIHDQKKIRTDADPTKRKNSD